MYFIDPRVLEWIEARLSAHLPTYKKNKGGPTRLHAIFQIIKTRHVRRKENAHTGLCLFT